MAFNINFGQSNIDNSLKRRELDLRQQQIDNQRQAQELSTFSSLANSPSVTGRRLSEIENFNLREREMSLKEKDFALRQEEQRVKLENLQKMSEKYDLAFKEDEIRVGEMMRQAQEREKMLNSELATIYLSSLRHGGNVSDSQLQLFNESTGENFDFIGNYANIPMQDGRIIRRAIGNNNSFYMGKFERDNRGNIVYGQDGTPVVSMIEMPAQMQDLIKRSAYGKEYLSGGGYSTRGTISNKVNDKGMFDMRISQINNLMAQRKALVEEGNPNNQKAIAEIDKQIGLLNQMNGSATGVSEFARALGVTGLGGNGGNNPSGYETVSSIEEDGGRVFNPEDTVESNGRTVKRVQHNPKSGEYIVNTKHEQSDGSYSFKVTKDKAHLGEKWVTFVDTDGKVKQRLREENDGFTEQHENGLYIKVKNQKGKTIDLFVPAGKVVKTAFGNKVVSGEKGNYTLVDTDEKPNWTAREGIIANWSNRDTEKRRVKEEEKKRKEDEGYAEAVRSEREKKNSWWDHVAHAVMAEDMNPALVAELQEKSDAVVGRQRYAGKKRSSANWGARRSGGTEFAQKANQILDELVAEKLGISVDEAKKTRELAESKKKKDLSGKKSQDNSYGLRNDGTTKGAGWLGELKLPNGGVATEYSIGVNIDGKEREIPTLVPNLTQQEIDLMVNDIIPNNKDVPESIVKKAVAHAKSQLQKGEDVFAPIMK